MRTPMSPRCVVLCVVASSMLLGCGSARRGEPFGPPLQLNAEQQQGQYVFMKHCHQCHPEGEGGLGPALNNKPLPGPAVRLQVRQGVGEMPAFDEQLISDADLKALSAYVLELQTPSRKE